ncbi:MAG: YhcH/YjgK/YiaL family protein [Planctomycetia bacterium]
MILDALSQWRRYASLNPRFARAFAFLHQFPADVADGRHEIEGDSIYALVQRYETRPVAGQFEAHRSYVDIQFIVTGREVIQWAPLESLTEVTKPYDDVKDAGFFAAGDAMVPVRVAAGQFAILFPDDAHAPGCAWAGPEPVVKVVVKVAVSTPA